MKLFDLFSFTSNVASGDNEIEIERLELPAIIQREWIERNNLQVDSTENIQDNDIPERQLLCKISQQNINYQQVPKLSNF